MEDIEFDNKTPFIVDAANVGSIMGIDKTTGLVGNVAFNLIVEESRKDLVVNGIDLDPGDYLPGSSLPTFPAGYKRRIADVKPGTYYWNDGTTVHSFILPLENKGVLFFDGEKNPVRWTLTIQPLPKNTVASNVIEGGTDATSQDAVYKFVEPINDKIGSILPVVTTNVTNPLKTGLFKNPGGLDEGWTNWKAIIDRPKNGAKFLHYKGNVPLLSGGFDTVYGRLPDNTLIVIIPGGTGSLLDTTTPIPDDVKEIIANFRATTGDIQLLEFIKDSELIPQDRVDGLNDLGGKINSVILDDFKIIEDITSPLAFGVMGDDGIVNTGFTNWRNNGKKNTNGAKYVRYRGTAPNYTSTSKYPYLLGWEDGATVPVNLASTATSKYIDEIIPIDSKYSKVTGNFRAIAGDKQILEIVEETTVLDGSRLNRLPKIKVLGRKNYCGTSKTYMDGKVRNGSIVKGYQTWIRDAVEFSLGERNYGLSGHSWAGNPENSNTIVDKMGTWDHAEIWSAEGPTNDYKLNAQVGLPSDFINNTGRNTLYGALRIYVEKVYSLSPSALNIFFIDCQRNNDSWTDNSVTPPVIRKYDGFTPNKAGFTLENYNDAFRWVARRIGAILVDAHNESRINQYNLGYYTVDGLHENDEGYKIEADLYVNRVYK